MYIKDKWLEEFEKTPIGTKYLLLRDLPVSKKGERFTKAYSTCLMADTNSNCYFHCYDLVGSGGKWFKLIINNEML